MAYIYGGASVFSQALYLLLVQKHASDFGAVESLHLNSFNTLPLLVIMSFVTREICPAVGELFSRLVSLNIGFILSFTTMIVFGCLLNYLLFLCTTYNSALTTSITGTLKTLLQTVAGMFAFGGVTINTYLLSGIALNFSGGLLYTLIKHRTVKEKLLADSKDEEAQIEIRDKNLEEWSFEIFLNDDLLNEWMIETRYLIFGGHVNLWVFFVNYAAFLCPVWPWHLKPRMEALISMWINFSHPFLKWLVSTFITSWFWCYDSKYFRIFYMGFEPSIAF